MDSDARRILSAQHDRHPYVHGHRDLYPGYYSYENLWDRLRSPPFFLSALLLALTVGYRLGFPQERLRSLPGLLWDFLVSATPARLLYAVDNWLNPPLFPRPMRLSPSPPPSHSHAAKSDVLQRILGTAKPTTLIDSLTKFTTDTLAAMDLERLYVAGDRTQPVKGPPGLVNGGNTCFRNSVLQSLASLKPFIEYLATRPLPSESSGKAKAPLLHALLTGLNRHARDRYLVAKELGVLDSGKQEDAQEYFSLLMDAIDREMKNNARPVVISKIPRDRADSGYGRVPPRFKLWVGPRAARNRFEGLLAERVSCRKCGHCDGIKLVPFNCLTLPLDGAKSRRLQTCLQKFTDIEVLDQVHCNKCTLLKNRADLIWRKDPVSKELLWRIGRALEEKDYDDETLQAMGPGLIMAAGDKTKETAIARPPLLLVLHINRSTHHGWGVEKNVSPVTFPFKLNIGPYMLGSAGPPAWSDPGDTTPQPDDPGATKPDDDDSADLTPDHIERWVTDPSSRLAAGNPKLSKIWGPKYSLNAIVLHNGDYHNVGHYIAFRKFPAPGMPENSMSESEVGGDSEKPAEPSWYKTSDTKVERSSGREVSQQKGVYMLFYECIEPNAIFGPNPPEPIPRSRGTGGTKPCVRLSSVETSDSPEDGSDDADEEFPMRSGGDTTKAADPPRDASHPPKSPLFTPPPDGTEPPEYPLSPPPDSPKLPEASDVSSPPEVGETEEFNEADVLGDLSRGDLLGMDKLLDDLGPGQVMTRRPFNLED